jgi:hypothetical protein
MTRPKGDDAFLSVRKSALKAVSDYPAEPGEIQLKKKNLSIACRLRRCRPGQIGLGQG